MKKKYISILIFIILIFYCENISINTNVIIPVFNITKIDVPIINHKIVNATAYCATEGQCNSNPTFMAWNDKITKKNKNSIVAVSRDMLDKKLLDKNTNIYYYDGNGVIFKKTVLDKMGKYSHSRKQKIKNSIDILTHTNTKAKKFGRKKIEIFWYGGSFTVYKIKLGEIMINDITKFMSGCEILEVSKLGYIRVKTPDGQELYISTKPPRNPAMYADFYQFTKMAMYLESGHAEQSSIFESYFRTNPDDGDFAISFGLGEVVNYLTRLEITGRDIDYLKGVWKFSDKFWEYLRAFKWRGILKGIPSGKIIGANVPVVQLEGEFALNDFVETKILNLLGGPISIGTKAFQMTLANPDVPWIEMAARRATSEEDGMLIAKYSYIGGAGGCIGTSLTAAGQQYGIPVKGTSSHSGVLGYEYQIKSFRSQGEIFRDDSVFILDTFNYISGIQDAILTAEELKLNKIGGRLDDDDLVFRSKVVREILDANGFKDSQIVVSGDLDANKRRRLRNEGAKNNCDGVGTSLVPKPLNIVYKPVKIGDRYVIKISGNKTTNPGPKNSYRMLSEDGTIENFVASLDPNIQNIGDKEFYNISGEKLPPFNRGCIEKLSRLIIENDQIFNLPPQDMEDKIDHSRIDVVKNEIPKIPNGRPGFYLDSDLFDIRKQAIAKYSK